MAQKYSSSAAPVSSGTTSLTDKYPAEMLPEFYSLYDINSDIKGWIKIANTDIDFPVVQTTDNEYYLSNDFNKNSNWYGTSFLDMNAKIDQLSKNLIIYGHNMGDDQMFHELVNYKKLDFYNSSPVISFNTIYGVYNWKIFAVFYTDADDNRNDVFQYLYTSFSSDERFTSFISDVRKRSLFNTSVAVAATDHILTLSTCTYEFKEARFVVMARLVRGGEGLAVDGAAKNPQVIMPNIWYKIFGGKKPAG